MFVDAKELFKFLAKQNKPTLLGHLHDAFDAMTAKQRRDAFADCVRPPVKAAVKGGGLRRQIEQFYRDSRAGKYYAPFAINSKNFMDVPEETEEWCDLFARFVASASKLTTQGDHAQAVACFAMLFELLQSVDSGDEIIFAEEAGSWMIPANEKQWLKAYLRSLAATATPEGFAAAALPLLEHDSHNSFAAGVHAAARKVANLQQKAHLQAEVQRRKIPTGRKS
jgi:plasmid stabilization system protein ParE